MKHIHLLILFTFLLFNNINNISVVNKKELTDISNDSLDTKLQYDLMDDIEYINVIFDSSYYRGNIENLNDELILFTELSKNIKRGIDSKNIKTNILAEELQYLTEALQTNELPNMRKEYIRQANIILRKKGIEVYSKKEGYTNIYFKGDIFSKKVKINRYQKVLHNLFYKYRFTEVNYYWINNNNVSYIINPPLDCDLY